MHFIKATLSRQTALLIFMQTAQYFQGKVYNELVVLSTKSKQLFMFSQTRRFLDNNTGLVKGWKLVIEML